MVRRDGDLDTANSFANIAVAIVRRAVAVGCHDFTSQYFTRITRIGFADPY